MAPRPSKADNQSVTVPEAAESAELGRGDRIPLQATVIRFDGPWVQLQVLGQLMTVLRSQLEKETNHHGR